MQNSQTQKNSQKENYPFFAGTLEHFTFFLFSLSIYIYLFIIIQQLTKPDSLYSLHFSCSTLLEHAWNTRNTLAPRIK